MPKEKGFHSSLVLNFSLILTLRETLIIQTNCPGGGIGRHKGLKIPRRKLRAGSSPAPGTIISSFNIQKSLIFWYKEKKSGKQSR